jgi:hypothetical protein
MDHRIKLARDQFGCEILPIDGFPGYFISDDGRVFSSIRRNGQKPGIINGKPLEPLTLVTMNTGYYIVNLHRERTQHTKHVHELVATAFIGKRRGRQVCRHLNGIPKDNRVCNLSWGTYRENEQDKEIHGRTARGTNHGMSKLTEEDVREIRSIRNMKQRDIAAIYGVHQYCIWAVISRVTWRHVS